MRSLARVFIVLFCVAFLFNHARAQSNELLGATIAKLTAFTLKPVVLVRMEIRSNEKRMEVIEARLEDAVVHLEQNANYKRPEVPKEAAAYMASLLDVELAQKEFDKARDEMLDLFRN